MEGEKLPLAKPLTPLAVPILRAEHMLCALHDRVFGLGMMPGERHWRAILLTSGSGVLSDRAGTMELTAPCLFWVAWAEHCQLRVRAGGIGYQLAVGDAPLAHAIGHNPDSADLRLLVDRRVLATLEDSPEGLAELEHAFQVILRETRFPSTGSASMAEAQLRAVLVLLWRHGGASGTRPPAAGQASRILQHFRQLLEVHFRDRWLVSGYAAAMGISPDRLHDICRRQLSKTPRQLVQERVLHEARLRLERSSQTVEQLAGALGFRDVGHFSRFFKNKLGIPPGAYRRRVLESGRVDDPISPSSYADWP